MRQTGGTALGETSTRSRPRSRAILSASKGGRMPSCSPFSSITRISRARIRSLMRIKDFAERLSSAMVLLQESPPSAFRGLPESLRAHVRSLSIALPRLPGTTGLQGARTGAQPRRTSRLLTAFRPGSPAKCCYVPGESADGFVYFAKTSAMGAPDLGTAAW